MNAGLKPAFSYNQVIRFNASLCFMQPSANHPIDAPTSTSSSLGKPCNEPLVAQIDAVLPQTQCGQCGYAGCWPYAEALARGEAEINQCPPGGDAGIHALANLLQQPYQPLNPAHGVTKGKIVAVIDEAHCIGCTLCIQACPVDAIVGASKHMHTVIQQECTGCELCLPPCPVDCIQLQAIPGREVAMSATESDLARRRHQQRLKRLALENNANAHTLNKDPAPQSDVSGSAPSPTEAIKQAAIAAALSRIQSSKQVKAGKP